MSLCICLFVFSATRTWTEMAHGLPLPAHVVTIRLVATLFYISLCPRNLACVLNQDQIIKICMHSWVLMVAAHCLWALVSASVPKARRNLFQIGSPQPNQPGQVLHGYLLENPKQVTSNRMPMHSGRSKPGNTPPHLQNTLWRIPS